MILPYPCVDGGDIGVPLNPWSRLADAVYERLPLLPYGPGKVMEFLLWAVMDYGEFSAPIPLHHFHDGYKRRDGDWAEPCALSDRRLIQDALYWLEGTGLISIHRVSGKANVYTLTPYRDPNTLQK